MDQETKPKWNMPFRFNIKPLLELEDFDDINKESNNDDERPQTTKNDQTKFEIQLLNLDTKNGYQNSKFKEIHHKSMALTERSKVIDEVDQKKRASFRDRKSKNHNGQILILD